MGTAQKDLLKFNQESVRALRQSTDLDHRDHRRIEELLTSGDLDQKVDELLEKLFPDALASSKQQIASVPGLAGYFDRFELLEEIGQGTFSRVFKAMDKALGNRLVVLKTGKLACWGDQGIQEAATSGRLNHKHIMPVHSCMTDELGITTICMPYLGRFTLADKLKALDYRFHASNCVSRRLMTYGRTTSQFPVHWKTQPEFPVLLSVLGQVCQALVYAHDQCVLHLDLKPSNILIGFCGNALLLDFNLARDILLRKQPSGGTLSYMSPEQLQRCILHEERELDERSDIYSFGVMLYEVFYGYCPFDAAGPAMRPKLLAQLVLERQRRAPKLFETKIPEMPKRLLKLIRRCLRFNRAERYSSMSQIQRELNAMRRRYK